jgi:acyl-coenzyme A thioesterase PaaI-like protein
MFRNPQSASNARHTGPALLDFAMTSSTDDLARLGLTPIDPFPGLAGGAFVSGDPQSDRLRVRYFHRTDDDVLVALVWFGPGTEGPPGHAHGGSVASALDEAMGGAAWAAGYPVVAARITIDFREMVPIGVEATIEARIERVDGRKIHTRGRLLATDGKVYADGEGLFIVLEPEQLERLAGRVR